MTLTGSGWTYEDTLTCTASAATFTVESVGNQVFLYDEDGVMVRFNITGYTSTTVVTGMVVGSDVPTSLRAVATVDWAARTNQAGTLLSGGLKAANYFADGWSGSKPDQFSWSDSGAAPRYGRNV